MDGDRLRQLLASGRSVLMPGVWDALSARLAAVAGFDVCFLSGYATSATLLGLPDFGYLTGTEMAEVARRVCRAVPDVAVVVDGDTGHGNALNTIRTVELFEEAGAAGIFLEDQVWPKKCGHMAGKRVVPRDEWLAKLQAALDARSHLFVVARTDARAAQGPSGPLSGEQGPSGPLSGEQGPSGPLSGEQGPSGPLSGEQGPSGPLSGQPGPSGEQRLAEACERARLAAELGVDAVFVEAPESPAEMEAVARATPGTVRVANMIEAGRTPLMTPAELHDLGHDLVVSPLTGLFAVARSLAAAYGVLYDRGTLRDDLGLLTTFDRFNRVVALDDHYGLEARYRTGPAP